MAAHATVEGAPAPPTEAATPTTSDEPPAVPWRGFVIIVSAAVYPFITFLATNREEGVGPEQVASYAAVCVVLGLVIVTGAWAIRGALSADRLAVTLGVTWFVTVNYPAIAGAVETLGLGVGYQLLGWGLVFIAVVVATWWASRRPAVRLWVLLFAVLITSLPLLQVIQHRVAVYATRQPAAAAHFAGLERTPDIYYVVPDAYGRADLLDEMFGFDNAAFLASLEQRGFIVAHDAYANYARTFLSVPSVLEMDYVAEPGPGALRVVDGDRLDRSAFYDIIGAESAVAETLRNAGYRYVHAPAGTWRGSGCSGAEDLCVEPISVSGSSVALDEVEWSLLQMTPAAAALESLGKTFDDVAADPAHTVREIVRQEWDEPVFAFIHMMHPHPPYPFDAECRPTESAGRSLSVPAQGSEPAYIAAMQCTNRRLEAMLDLLPSDAVVIIQADHGSDYRGQPWYPEARWGDEHLAERFAILSAIRLPEDCRDMVDDRFAGVNTFRVVLACLSGEEPELLRDRYMYNESHNHPDLHEIERPTTGR